MRFLVFALNGQPGLAVAGSDGRLVGLLRGDDGFPGLLPGLIDAGVQALSEAANALKRKGRPIDINEVEVLPPLSNPQKIICIGLNYADHAAEGGFTPPEYPTIFARFSSSLVGHNAPIVRPRVSKLLDYEGELAIIIGKSGRYIGKDTALEHVAGYSIFNDGSIRDYQLRTPQWTIGKTFDGTGGFGPYFVTTDEVPDGASGLHIETRLNGEVVQSASTENLIFDVATLIEILSEAMTLVPGDVIVSGTPSGVGHARTPPLYMKPGDVCEVDVEGLGVLRNPIVDEQQ